MTKKSKPIAIAGQLARKLVRIPSESITEKISKNKALSLKNAMEGITEKQLMLDLGVEAYKEYEGLEVGVLANGTPFFTQRGLGTFVGVANSHIGELSSEWESERFDTNKERLLFVKKYLDEHGYTENHLYIETRRNGKPVFAYQDIVCMAVLEYYAFESKKANKVALQRFRLLAQKSLRDFIYDLAGYHPATRNITTWRHFYDRVSINKSSVPHGYFSIFREAAGLIVDMLEAEYPLSDKTVPDGSIGIYWSKYYKENLENDYGPTIEYDHNYPSYFRQAESNPQKAKAYPIECLGIFRKWLEDTYILSHFPKYIKDKVKKLGIGEERAIKLINLYTPIQIEHKDN
jgi:hypothetical protein